MLLAYLAANQPEATSVIDSVVSEQQTETPEVPEIPAVETQNVVDEVIEEMESQDDIPNVGDSQAADIPE